MIPEARPTSINQGGSSPRNFTSNGTNGEQSLCRINSPKGSGTQKTKHLRSTNSTKKVFIGSSDESCNLNNPENDETKRTNSFHITGFDEIL